jgi:hypothetical protein
MGLRGTLVAVAQQRLRVSRRTKDGVRARVVAVRKPATAAYPPLPTRLSMSLAR